MSCETSRKNKLIRYKITRAAMIDSILEDIRDLYGRLEMTETLIIPDKYRRYFAKVWKNHILEYPQLRIIRIPYCSCRLISWNIKWIIVRNYFPYRQSDQIISSQILMLYVTHIVPVNMLICNYLM
jgi:hypothetical protein